MCGESPESMYQFTVLMEKRQVKLHVSSIPLSIDNMRVEIVGVRIMFKCEYVCQERRQAISSDYH